MKRRINSTDRKKILLKDLKISMIEVGPDEHLKARAELDLATYGLPEEAKVIIEAYYRSSSQRFDCGTAGDLKIPKELVLDQVDHSGAVLFRVKVVMPDEPFGLILGSAERVHPRSDGETGARKSLFPVLFRNLGAEIWLVDVQPDSRPSLVLNKRLPEIRHRLETDPVIQGFLLPAALRIVLEELVKNPDEDEDGEDDWKRDWKDFCKAELGVQDPPPGLGAEEEEKDDWIKQVVTRFCEKHRFLKNIQSMGE